MKVIVEEAHRVGKRVAAHTTTDQATRIAADAGVNSIEHGYSLPDDVLKTMHDKGHLSRADGLSGGVLCRRAGRTATPEERHSRLAAAKPFVTRSADRLMRAIKRRRANRVRIGRVLQRAGQDARTVELAHAAGVSGSRHVADRRHSRRDAQRGRSAGLGDRIGAIEAGKLADIIAVDGDPLKDVKDLQRVRFVMKAGQIIRNDRRTTK